MKKPEKRICVIRHGFYPEDPRVYKEVRALAGAGYDVDVICLRQPGEQRREQSGGARIYRLPHLRRRDSKISYVLEYSFSLLVIGAVLSLLYCRRRYSCIQVNTLPDILVFVTLLPRLFGARIVLDMHEPTPELMLSRFDGKVCCGTLKLQCLLEQMAICYAHHVITVNDTICWRFIERGADPEKMSVVRNVPPEEFGLTASSRIPHDGFIIMTHGTVQPRYGHALLLSALPLCRSRIPGLRLIIAGQDDSETGLKQMADELNCRDIVTFTGQVSRDRIAELISQADIGIVPLMPGPFSELCQPNKLFEYTALGTPVIAARLPAIEESFDASCIRYFTAGDHRDLAEAVVALSQDTWQRSSLAGHAFARYQAMRWSAAKNDYVRVMDTLIEPPARRRTYRTEQQCSTE